MNACACGCGAKVKGTWFKGHHFRKRPHVRHLPPTPDLPSDVTFFSAVATDIAYRGLVIHEAGYKGPPVHPLPFDHGKFRIAEEPPGANLYAPWEEFRCVECRESTWRHDSRADLCESCAYLLFSELSEKRISNESRVRPPHDPFA